MAQRGSKSTQRERLLRAVVDVANRAGLARATIAAVIAEAGVSRRSFYEYFTDRDDCYLAALTDADQRLRRTVQKAIAAAAPEGASTAAVTAIVGFASTEPARARFVMSESMAGGPRALDIRDRGIGKLAASLEKAAAKAAAGSELADIEGHVLIGGVYRLLATRLRRGDPAISKLTGELETWLQSYSRPVAELRWGKLEATRAPAPSPHVPEVPIQQMPRSLPPGRPKLTDTEIAENHRLRILYAAARMAETHGYTATKIADITKLAGVDGHAFYQLFADKQDAFMAVHELGFQQVMNVTSTAFFAGKHWPERSWEAGRALTQLLDANPLVAHVGFVEAYAVGPGAVQRVEDSHIAFMFFLQEGLVYRQQETPPTRLAMEATIACIFEIIYLRARTAGPPQLAGMLPYVAHVWLTPFLGALDADEFIDAQLATS